MFSNGQRQSDATFTCISLVNTEGLPRLGLVVTRKNVRRAVDRNRLRRVVRESFRLHCATLPSRDIVVMLRSGAERQPNPALRDSLERHWQRMVKA